MLLNENHFFFGVRHRNANVLLNIVLFLANYDFLYSPVLIGKRL